MCIIYLLAICKEYIEKSNKNGAKHAGHGKRCYAIAQMESLNN